MEFLGAEFNLVDLIAICLLLLSAIAGIRRGFIGGLLDLVLLVAAIYLAFKGYRVVGSLLTEALPLPMGITNLGAFIGLYIVIQALFSLVFHWLGRQVGGVLRFFPMLRFGNAIAGVVPGLIKGIAVFTLVILPFGLFPIVSGLKDDIDSSFLGGRLISLASVAVPRVESFFGQTVEDNLVFLSRPTPGSSIKLNFPSPSKLTEDLASEQRMLELLNSERVKAGLQPFVMDEKLRLAARDHSREMFELSYFAHESPVVGDPLDRLRAEGARFTIAAENIAYAPNVEMAHSGLMNSPDHRKNILTPGFKRVGIGVVDGGLRGEMFTQDFSD